jgi:putative alpha-1,2-mannosidase
MEFQMSKSPAEWVNPLIDSANRRFFFFSSACRPFGMVNLSPDTAAGGGAWEAGYRYDNHTICWFSHIHGWQISGIPVLPTTGPMRGHEGVGVYKSSFSHDHETVQPGYHQVALSDYSINAELTATDRVGFHRYTFPKTKDAHILFDLTTTIGPSDITDASIEKVSDTELAGFVENGPTRRRPKSLKIYFVAQFDRPIENLGGWRDGKVIASSQKISGAKTGAFVKFTTNESDVVQLKVAISYCDIDGARNNLNTELPHWDFDQVRQEAFDAWNQYLGRIVVEGGSDEQKRNFTPTCITHCSVVVASATETAATSTTPATKPPFAKSRSKTTANPNTNITTPTPFGEPSGHSTYFGPWPGQKSRTTSVILFSICTKTAA